MGRLPYAPHLEPSLLQAYILFPPMPTLESTSRPSQLVQLRSRPVRGSYSRDALKEIFKANPVAHCAYMHSGEGMEGPDGDESPRILNLPLLSVLREYQLPDVEGIERSDEHPAAGELVVYLHTYYGSRLVQAVKKGLDSITISTTKVDGLVLGHIPKGHSVNYRSATIYGHSPVLLPNTPAGIAEKIKALEAVIDDVTGYNRTAHIGLTEEQEAKSTAVLRIRIEDASCKQRTGGAEGDIAPVEIDEKDVHPGGPMAHEFIGVIPCWTQFGEARGVGRHKVEVQEAMEKLNAEGEAYALEVALARGKINGR